MNPKTKILVRDAITSAFIVYGSYLINPKLAPTIFFWVVIYWFLVKEFRSWFDKK